MLSNAANKSSKLKRKRLVDGVSSPYSTKVANGAAKQATCKQAAVRKTKYCKSQTLNPCPRSDGCARASINGWEWHRWSLNASPAERAHIRGIKYVTADYLGSDVNTPQWSNSKGLSARTNRAKLRNLLAAAEGADLLKATQLKVMTINLDLMCSFVSCLRMAIYSYCYLAGKKKMLAFPAEQDT